MCMVIFYVAHAKIHDFQEKKFEKEQKNVSRLLVQTYMHACMHRLTKIVAALPVCLISLAVLRRCEVISYIAVP